MHMYTCKAYQFFFCMVVHFLSFSNRMSAKLQKAKQEALWGMFVADALAMPVHWYYNPSDIKSGYGGWLTGYRAPEKHHPSSILTISATGNRLEV